MMNGFDPIGAQAQAQMQITRTHAGHIPGKYEALPQRGDEETFRGALMSSLEDVNSHQMEHEQLSIQAVVDPQSVEAHDLTIAAARATTSLSITKNVVDRVVQAYRDITSLR